MPNFRTTLPPKTDHQGFDLKRTPVAAPISAIATSDDILVCDTHYFQGRTVPCERILNEDGRTVDDSPCPACQHKQPWRTHVYIFALNPKTHEHFIYECTSNAAKAFAEYREHTGTLRGCAFTAERPKHVPNGKVVIQTRTADLSRTPLPKAPDLALALTVIWRIPGNAVTTEPTYFPDVRSADGYAVKPPAARLDPAALAKMRTQPDNAEDEQTFLTRRRELNEQLAAAQKPNGKHKTPCAT